MKNIYTFKQFNKYPNIVHLITQKDTLQPYQFSLALHTQENPVEILKNRAYFKEKYPHMNFIVANQTHSDNIHLIKMQKESGWEKLENAIKNCDALITNQKNIMLTILTADCVPILLFDPIQNAIGAVHAGWKGTQQEIVKKTVKKMQNEFNSKPSNLIVGIAPSIGKCCYEVDSNVAQHFEKIKNSYTQKENKYMLDLSLINQTQLIHAGVKEKNIELSNICTACEVDQYFSYRKEKGCSGRFMSMIGLV
jgi:hypothetical protein